MNSYPIFYQQLERIFSSDPEMASLPLETILDSIPTIDELPKIPPGSVVLIRTDLDMPIEEEKVADLSRIQANSPTIRYCMQQGWKVVLFGHIGRDKELSVAPVCKGYSQELKQEIEMIPEWLDEANMKLLDPVVEKIKSAKPGALFMLENTRKYEIETALWKAKKENLPPLAEKMYTLASDVRRRLSSIEINEAIAACNFDFSSSVLPLTMEKTGFGFFISEEIKAHITRARRANLVVISGLKINKLDDLEAMLALGRIKWVIAAGSLAMALKKADAHRKGKDFCIGRAESDPNEKSYIDSKRIEQGKRIVQRCFDEGIELILPIDFILDDGQISPEIPAERLQFDIGPKTRELINKTISEYIDQSRRASEPFTMFHNGVFGKFEKPKYEQGTKEFIGNLKRMTQEGIRTYVGGGEGRLALLKFGSLDDVTHAFTAGGTVLKSLSNKHIHFLKAMYIQNQNRG